MMLFWLSAGEAPLFVNRMGAANHLKKAKRTSFHALTHKVEQKENLFPKKRNIRLKNFMPFGRK
jgi:hypothetical protein